ncbi:MAG: radical SAM family heme chaperone HemW [Bacilli bacterium]|nr:radical SAM family heme chaperone HemW [Bacilli bacterium]
MKSVYIHIPFCDNICSYCDFNKFYYNQNLVDEYLNSLKNEIKTFYTGELINTIYIGGGTPSSLTIKQLEKLFNIINIFNKSDDFEFTIECNPENMNVEKINLLKENNVNRVSIGVQSFNKNILKLLNRKHSKNQVIELINNLNDIGINNINIDMMFGINIENIKTLDEDLDIISKLNIKHISYYSLILEENTMLYINKYIEQDEDTNFKHYEYICNKLKELGYNHYEISNFSKKGYKSKHNLTYWNNNEYYGFGCGAHGFINNIRYENTRSLTKYINKEYKLNSEEMTKKINMENEIMLGLRKLSGINKNDFYKKYNIDIYEIFSIKKYINNKTMIDDGNNVYINPKYIYVSNEILVGLLESSE